MAVVGTIAGAWLVSEVAVPLLVDIAAGALGDRAPVWLAAYKNHDIPAALAKAWGRAVTTVFNDYIKQPPHTLSSGHADAIRALARRLTAKARTDAIFPRDALGDAMSTLRTAPVRVFAVNRLDVQERLAEVLAREIAETTPAPRLPESFVAHVQERLSTALFYSFVEIAVKEDEKAREQIAFEHAVETFKRLWEIQRSLDGLHENADELIAGKDRIIDILTDGPDGGMSGQLTRAADNTDEIKAQVAEVKTIAERTLAATGLTWAQVTLKPLSAALPAHHVERAELLAGLHAKVAKGGSAGVRQAAAAHGDGGEGKTVLALAYAYEAMKGRFGEAHRYPGGVFIVHVGTDAPALAPGRLKEALAELLQGLPGDAKLTLEQRAGLVKGKLSQAPASLLIIDNVMDGAQWSSPEFSAWLPGPACAIVATTRAEALGGLAMQRVGELSFEQAREVLAGSRPEPLTPAHDAAHDACHEAVHSIWHELGGLALGVSTVGAYMSLEKGKTWAQEAAWLAGAPTEAFHDRAEAVQSKTGYPGKLRAVLDALRARLPDAERLALDFAAHLPQGNVPTGWLEDLVEGCVGEDAGALKVEMGERPSGDAQTPAGVVGHLVDLGLLPLERDELKEVEPEGSTARRRAMVRTAHRLHARRAREAAGEDKARRHALLLAIARHAARRGSRLASAGEDGVQRWIDAANRWELAPLAALVAPPRAIDFDHADVALTLNPVAFVLHSLGRAGEAEPIFREALDMFRRLFVGDHPDVAASLSNLAVTLFKRGERTESRALIAQAAAMIVRVFGPGHPTSKVILGWRKTICGE